MKALRLIPFLLLGALVALTGCRSSSKVAEDELTGVVQPDSSKVYTQAIHVLVDGRDMGVIPKTVRIRRSFGTRMVSLWQAGKEIRTYEIEISSTADGDQTLQGFWSTNSMTGDSYNVQNLPNDGEENYRIPYSERPLTVEDHTYGVTLHVQN